MNTEQKAEAYDNLIERLKDFQFVYRLSAFSDTIDKYFPELRKSEDERIRENLIAFLKTYNTLETSRYISWLEKQNIFSKKDVDDAYLKGVTDTKNEIGKQYEENYQIRKDIATFIFNYRGDIKDRAKWMNYLGIKVSFGEKQSKQETLCDKCNKEQPSHSCQDITALGRCAVEHEQKLADNVKPKFKAGDWVISTLPGIKYPHLITDIQDGYYIFGEEDDRAHIASNDDIFKLWTIQDAKDGDVLSYVTDEGDLWIMIYQSLYEPYEGHVHYHALLVNDDFFDKGTCCICINDLKPATKEQHKLLFKKMKEAGYEWDAEKKELKKIVDEEQIKKNLQNHDFRRMFEQKPDWSEEDEEHLNSIISDIKTDMGAYPRSQEVIDIYNDDISFLKSLKDRVQPQPKQKWSEEDEKMIEAAINLAHEYGRHGLWVGLKSLKDRYTWKPSDEQMLALDSTLQYSQVSHNSYENLNSLYNDLKKLTE
jgi:hypothetical protein